MKSKNTHSRAENTQNDVFFRKILTHGRWSFDFFFEKMMYPEIFMLNRVSPNILKNTWKTNVRMVFYTKRLKSIKIPYSTIAFLKNRSPKILTQGQKTLKMTFFRKILTHGRWSFQIIFLVKKWCICVNRNSVNPFTKFHSLCTVFVYQSLIVLALKVGQF